MEEQNESQQVLNAQQDSFDQFDAAFEEEEGVAQSDVSENPEPTPALVENEPQIEPESEILPTSEPEQKEPEQSNDWQHKYDSMMGRLNKSQNENADLRQQIAAMQAQLQQMQAKPVEPRQEPEVSEVEGIEMIPDELAPLFKENSKDGERVRRLLEEYGPEHAMMAAENLMTRRHTESAQAAWQREREEDKLAAHKARLSHDHPEYAAAFNGNAEKFNELFNGVSAWIDLLPYSKGREMARIAQNGTTAEVSAMLSEYKQFRAGSQKSAAVQNLAKANLAVPAGKAPQPKPKATDFDSAWDEAMNGE